MSKQNVYKTANITHTIIGTTLQISSTLGIPYKLIPHSTLNELFQIQHVANLEPNEQPHIGYYCIGSGGHDFTTVNRSNGKPRIAKVEKYKHDPKDAGLYDPVPFVLRRLNNDLPDERRVNYGLRRIENIGGVDYIAYYAKRLNFKNVAEVQILIDRVDNGVVTPEPYVPDSRNLNPVRPELSPKGKVIASNAKLRNNVSLSIVFDEFDVNEFINAVRILNDGDESLAIISEIALCSGVDRTVSGRTEESSPILYKEVIGCQVNTFVSLFTDVTDSNGGFTIHFDMGNRTPLIASQDLGQTSYYTETGTVGSANQTGH